MYRQNKFKATLTFKKKLGQEDFQGEIIHAQKYNSAYDENLANKKVAIIGSGATAVTIFPIVSNIATRTTLVQRTPSYIASIPAEDISNAFLNKWLPKNLVTVINR